MNQRWPISEMQVGDVFIYPVLSPQDKLDMEVARKRRRAGLAILRHWKKKMPDTRWKFHSSAFGIRIERLA